MSLPDSKTKLQSKTSPFTSQTQCGKAAQSVHQEEHKEKAQVQEEEEVQAQLEKELGMAPVFPKEVILKGFQEQASAQEKVREAMPPTRM